MNLNKKKYQGLVCDLPLNEGGGLKCYDRTGLSASPAIVTSAELKTFTKGPCAYFDGTAPDDVVIGKPTVLNLQNSAMTVSLWCHFVSVGNYRYLVSDYNAAGNTSQFSLILNNTNRFTFFWVTGGTQSPNPTTAQSVTTAAANIWYHVVGVRSGATGAWSSKIYVNGICEKITATAGNAGAQSGAGNVTVGQPGDFVSASLSMNGYIKDVKIFNRALTDSEVMAIYIDEKNKL